MNVAIIACLAGITVFSGCDKNNGAITVTDEQSLTQEVYADNVSGNAVTSFTTTGAWTSSIVETTKSKSSMLKSGTLDWISIDPASGDKAGTYNVSIILEPNTTGADRTAIITITCKGEEIKVTVTQKGTTQGGEVPTNNYQDFDLMPILSRFQGYYAGKTFATWGEVADFFKFDGKSDVASAIFSVKMSIKISGQKGVVTVTDIKQLSGTSEIAITASTPINSSTKIRAYFEVETEFDLLQIFSAFYGYDGLKFSTWGEAAGIFQIGDGSVATLISSVKSRISDLINWSACEENVEIWDFEIKQIGASGDIEITASTPITATTKVRTYFK